MDYQVELDGKIFQHQKGTIRFYNIDNENEVISFRRLVKELSQGTWRCMAMRYKAPQGLLLLGAASRIKVMRAVQLHYYEPMITPYISDTLTPLLQYMSDDNTDCGGNFEIQQQFYACSWAINKNMKLRTTNLRRHYLMIWDLLRTLKMRK